MTVLAALSGRRAGDSSETQPLRRVSSTEGQINRSRRARSRSVRALAIVSRASRRVSVAMDRAIRAAAQVSLTHCQRSTAGGSCGILNDSLASEATTAGIVIKRTIGPRGSRIARHAIAGERTDTLAERG